MKKAKSLLVLLAVLLGLTGGPAFADLKANRPYHIAVIMKAADVTLTAVANAAVAEAKRLGCTATVNTASAGTYTDIISQVNAMQDAITNGGTDAIFLNPADTKGLNSAIVMANKAKIPVILVSDTVDLTSLAAMGGHVETWTGLGFVQDGQNIAKWVNKNVQPGSYAVIEGAPGSSSSILRIQGWDEGISKSFTKVASQTANWDMDQAYTVMQNLATAHPDIKLVYAANSPMGLGALRALQDAKLTDKIKIVDMDAFPDDLPAIKAGTIIATIRYKAADWGISGMQLCIRALNGEKLPAEVPLASRVIDKTNVDTLSIDAKGSVVDK
jgi:ABC-type sugar transport system substrate-binding protein